MHSCRTDKHDTLKRLHCIEGHLAGIGKMIEGDASCIDVLRQMYAVRKAIEKLETLLAEKHLAVYVHQAMMSGDEEALIAALALFYHPVEEYSLQVIVS